MGFYRNLYFILGIEYIGRIEQQQIQRQHGLKSLTLHEMRNKEFNKILTNKNLFINKVICKSKIKNMMKKKLKKQG